MEVPAGQDGIQQLLQAETEAQAIVSKARQGTWWCFRYPCDVVLNWLVCAEKMERLKQAKEEATREVQAYKREKDAEYARSMESDVSDNKSLVEKLQKESDEQIARVQQSLVANKGAVLDLLLSQVKSV